MQVWSAAGLLSEECFRWNKNSITAKNVYKTHQLNSDGWVVGRDNGGSGITQSVLSGSYAEDQK